MMTRLLPHPLLSVLIVLTWMMLVNSFSWASLVFAVLLGIVVPQITDAYWPDRPRIRHPLRMIEYVLIVLWDICKADVVVGQIILFKPNRNLRPAWITVPLDLTSPEAIAVLASTITLTPGTLTADLSEDGHALLVHCLHAPDPQAVIDEIKSRYEARLKEIFP
ncbi:Na+/H+ antiporter subunit E [Paracoccus pacificus]|uniref:Na+/H+ antiporter subunit E n=1 Tax=Paracoccus pacificus TaxID=1463598 RepID=A0ABW4RA10_9RHOB